MIDSEPAEATELVMSDLWDLGSTGMYEATPGTVIAGFDTRAAADSAVAELETMAAVDTGSTIVEPAPDAARLAGDDEPAPVEVGTGAHRSTLMIRAGGAFGHGAHPTTRLCLDLLMTPAGSADRVLDVGTGTGVLAIAAATAGAGAVVAIDNDPIAVDMAIENVARNDVTVICSGDTIDEVLASDDHRGFDLVVVNVLLAAHRTLADDIVRAVRLGGSLITAGYLNEQADELLDLYGPTPRGLPTMVATRSIDGWSAHHLQLQPPEAD